MGYTHEIASNYDDFDGLLIGNIQRFFLGFT